MSSSDILISDSDIFICEAFKQILAKFPAELENKLGCQARPAIATYLTQLPPTEQLDPAAMANHITEFCQRPGNAELKEWLGETYDCLDQDGIDKLVKKTGDPGDEADALTETSRMLSNEGRDICQFLQNWATEVLNQNNPDNQTQVQSQGNQRNQNASN
jgi:hypothetical protein